MFSLISKTGLEWFIESSLEYQIGAVPESATLDRHQTSLLGYPTAVVPHGHSIDILTLLFKVI